MRRAQPEWRFGRGWTAQELEQRLAQLARLPEDTTAESRMDPAHGYGQHFSEALIALEPHGPPARGGPFERGRAAVEAYAFSDPRIVTGHFDPRAPLLGRAMLLELRVWGLRYLCGVRVSAVRDEDDEHDGHGGHDEHGGGTSVFGFRYHTVPPHIESGAEWFLLTKRHDTGEVRFRIEAMWRAGQFPNWWSRLGFRLLVRRRQRAWHRLAHLRLRTLVASPEVAPLPRDRALVDEGPALEAPAVRSLMPRRRKLGEMEVEI